MKRSISLVPGYTIANLCRLTAVVAVVLGVIRLMGPQAAWLVFLVAYAFAPTIAMAIFILLRAQPMAVRFVAAGLTLVLFVTGAVISCGLVYGEESMWLASLGALVEWPGQAAVLLCLYLLHRASGGGELHSVNSVDK